MTSSWTQWRPKSPARRLDCLLDRLFKCRPKRISKLRVTGLFVMGLRRWPVDSTYKEASDAENVSIWWRHHVHIFLHMHTGTYHSKIVRKSYGVSHKVTKKLNLLISWYIIVWLNRQSMSPVMKITRICTSHGITAWPWLASIFLPSAICGAYHLQS